MNINSIAFGSGEEQESIVVSLSAQTKYKVFLLDSPPRLVLDVATVTFPGAENALRDYEGTLLKALRFAQYSPTQSRLVFDLARPVASISSAMLPDGRGGRIEIVLTGKTVGKKKEEKPLIAIDPGHGGQDPGAIGPRGTHEKNVTLKIARRLKESLEKTGRYRAMLTRDRDRFILLRDRFQIARKKGARLFISLHADSAPSRTARGLSVYTLSDKASDEESAALATQENKADLLSGMDLSHTSEDVANILIDLAQHETKSKSGRVADTLVRTLGKEVALLPNPHRFAGFAVLKAPDIPSVLVELGFISHPQEERLLNTDLHHAKLVKGLVDGIDSYFKKGIRE